VVTFFPVLKGDGIVEQTVGYGAAWGELLAAVRRLQERLTF
jgi:hypothetical protein